MMKQGKARQSTGGGVVVRNSWWVERVESSMTGERRSAEEPGFELGR